LNARVGWKQAGFKLLSVLLTILWSCGALGRPLAAQQDTPPPETTDIPAALGPVDEAPLKFAHLSLEQGLSQSTVLCILQDRRGFMWFGTQDGLNRYDGYTFKVYKHDPENTYSLSRSFILHLYEDQRGMMWVATADGGLNRYDPEADRFYRYLHDPQDPASWNAAALWQTAPGVYAIESDADGSVWFGTYGGGLSRYLPETDSFVHYRNNPDDPLSLAHDKVYALYRDRAGVLWVGTAAGLNRYDPQTDGFIRYPYHEPDTLLNQRSGPWQLSSPYAKLIYEDRAGQLWIGTLGGLNKFDRDTGRFTAYQHDPDNPRTLSGDLIRVLYEDSTGKLWLAYWEGGLDQFDPTTGRATRYQHDADDPHSLSDDYVTFIHEDRAGKLWVVATGEGVNLFERETGKFIPYRYDPADADSLSDNAIESLLEDRDSVLWLGTGGRGVNWYDPAWNTFPAYRVTAPARDEVGNTMIFALTSAAIDDTTRRATALWVGTRVGLNYWDRETGAFTLYGNEPQNPESLSAGGVVAVLPMEDGIWVATESGLDWATVSGAGAPELRFTHVITPGIADIYQDANGVLWLAQYNRGLLAFDPARGTRTLYSHAADKLGSLISNGVTLIEPSRDGGLWIGTDSGLDYFDPAAGVFTHYTHDPNNPYSLAYPEVRSVYEAEDGIVWVGTNGGGLDRFDRRTGEFTHYREGQEMPNGVIYAVIPDRQRNFWIPTNNGLVKFTPDTQTFKTYTRAEGLPSNEFDVGAYYAAPDGELFFGGVNGITAFYPEAIVDNPHAPPIMLTSLTQGGEPTPLDGAVEHAQTVTFQWPVNFFEFEFAALSYGRPEKNQYAYMLEGLDKDWNYVGTRRFGRYTNLAGGTYTLHLKGSNGDGVWNEAGTAVEIIVSPPFWGTWWFKAFAVLSGVGMVLVGYRVRVESIKGRNRSLEIEVARRTAQLRAEVEQRLHVEEELHQHKMAEAVAAERSRLARELHDAVTQTLFSTSMIAEALPVIWEKDIAEGRRRAQELRLLSRGALAEMRTLLMELRPAALLETGLDELVRQLGEAVAGRTGIPIAVTVHGTCRLSEEVHIALYRIAQEALNNVVKHARASQVTLTLECVEGCEEEQSSVELRIGDDGCGFDSRHILPDHLGLGIMQERADAIGATLQVVSAPWRGTQIIAIWPAEEESDDEEGDEGWKGAIYEPVAVCAGA